MPDRRTRVISPPTIRSGQLRRVRAGTALACYGLILGILAGCPAANVDAPAHTDGATKIDMTLATAAEAVARGTPTSASVDAQGRLLIYVYVTDTTAATQDAVTGAGLMGSRPSAEMAVIQGWAAPKDLPALAALSCVRRLTLPSYASPR